MPKQTPRILHGAAPRADGTPEGINLSQLINWSKCRYRWNLRYRRHIQRRGVHLLMDRGSAVHAGIAAGIRHYSEFSKPQLTTKRRLRIHAAASVGVNAFGGEWIKEHGELREETQVEEFRLLKVQAEMLAMRALDELELDRWEIVRLKDVPLIEQKLTIPFLPGLPFYGTADVVWRDRADKHKSTWVADWKVRKSLQSVEHEEVDLQLPTYQYILERLGIATTGSIKFQILAELPKTPTLNKNGSMSRARIATTWDVYEQALLQAGLDPVDYQEEMQQKLDVPFFKLDRLYRNQWYITNVWDSVIVPLGKLWSKSKSQVRSMHFMNCNGCWAREFCLAELKGEDTGFLLETSYMDVNDPRAKLVLTADDFDFTE